MYPQAQRGRTGYPNEEWRNLEADSEGVPHHQERP